MGVIAYEHVVRVYKCYKYSILENFKLMRPYCLRFTFSLPLIIVISSDCVYIVIYHASVEIGSSISVHRSVEIGPSILV